MKIIQISVNIVESGMDKFYKLVDSMQYWRNEDHSDFLTLHRNEVIELIEGINKLQEI